MNEHATQWIRTPAEAEGTSRRPSAVDILVRVVKCWLAMALFVLLMLALTETYQRPETLFLFNLVNILERHLVVFAGSFAIVPILAYDLNRAVKQLAIANDRN